MDSIAAWALGPQNAAIQVVTPNEMRGQITAHLIFTIKHLRLRAWSTVIALTNHLCLRRRRKSALLVSLLSGILGLPAD